MWGAAGAAGRGPCLDDGGNRHIAVVRVHETDGDSREAGKGPVHRALPCTRRTQLGTTQKFRRHSVPSAWALQLGGVRRLRAVSGQAAKHRAVGCGGWTGTACCTEPRTAARAVRQHELNAGPHAAAAWAPCAQTGTRHGPAGTSSARWCAQSRAGSAPRTVQ